MYRFLLCLMLLFLPTTLLAPTIAPPKNPPFVSVDCLNNNLLHAIEPIRKDVGLRFPTAYVLLGHGDKGTPEQWNVIEDDEAEPVQYRVDRIRKYNPDVPIVLWVCNEFGHTLKGKNVWHFKTAAWATPDSTAIKDWDIEHETEFDYNISGSVYEMIEGT